MTENELAGVTGIKTERASEPDGVQPEPVDNKSPSSGNCEGIEPIVSPRTFSDGVEESQTSAHSEN